MRRHFIALFGVIIGALLLTPIALADTPVIPGSETETGITELDAWNGLIAIAIPFIVSLLTTTQMSWKVKVGISVVLSVVAAFITTGLEHGWHVDDGHYVRSALGILIASQVFYRMLRPATDKVEAKYGLTPGP